MATVRGMAGFLVTVAADYGSGAQVVKSLVDKKSITFWLDTGLTALAEAGSFRLSMVGRVVSSPGEWELSSPYGDGPVSAHPEPAVPVRLTHGDRAMPGRMGYAGGGPEERRGCHHVLGPAPTERKQR